MTTWRARAAKLLLGALVCGGIVVLVAWAINVVRLLGPAAPGKPHF